MPENLIIFSFAELVELAANISAVRDISALHDQCYFLFTEPIHSVSDQQVQSVSYWLNCLSCPSICIAMNEVAHSVCSAADVLVTSAEEAALLVKNIQSAPITASVFTQLLRCTQSLSALDALNVESLAYATLQSGAEFKNWLQKNPPTATSTDCSEPPVLITNCDSTLQIRLNRPHSNNAISIEMRDALVEAFQLLNANPSIKNVQVSGVGKCFSIGGDLAEFGSTPNPAVGHIVRHLSLPARYLLPIATHTEFYLHGACIGAGIELPAFSHRISADQNTFFQLPELRFGLIPGAGGCVSIPRRIGRQRTAWLVLSGKRINAHKALEWGLIDHIS